MMNVEVCNRQPYLVFIIYFSQYNKKIMMMNVEVCNRHPYLVFIIYFSQYFLQNYDDECEGL